MRGVGIGLPELIGRYSEEASCQSKHPLRAAPIDKRQATHYGPGVILSFKHRGLRALYNGRGSGRVPPEHFRKIKRILTVLDQSSTPRDMDLPGFRLHPLAGDLKGHYAVSVSGNWRVTFRFEDGEAVDVDYTDYH